MPGLIATDRRCGRIANFVSASTDGTPLIKVEAYVPHEGDIILYQDSNLFWKVVYKLARTEPPDHSGIVVLLPDRKPVALEAGPDMEIRVFLLDLSDRLSHYRGTIRIRRVKKRLSPKESARLTDFALARSGKPFACLRMVLQLTPFCSHGKLRSKLFGKTVANRRSWFCSELVVSAGEIVGLFDPAVHKANAIYPRDLADNAYYDLSNLGGCRHLATDAFA